MRRKAHYNPRKPSRREGDFETTHSMRLHMIRFALSLFLLIPTISWAQPSESDQVITIADLALEETSATKRNEKTDFRLRLETGEVIDVAKVFEPHSETLTAELRKRLRGKPSSLVRINRPDTDTPLLVAARRGKQLDGPFVSYNTDGKPFASVQYSKGKRDSVLLTWDEAGRPRVFAQYSEGKLDGLRCLFRACSETCTTGHLWMVQRWEADQLKQTHIVTKDGKTLTVDYRNDQPLQSDAEAGEALDALAEFERRFDADEAKLERYIAKHYIRERQAIAMRTHAASQNRIRFLTSLYASNPGGYGNAPIDQGQHERLLDAIKRLDAAVAKRVAQT